MLRFISRRIGISFLVLLGASLLMYVLTINAGDPLADLRESNSENKQNLMDQRTEIMGLNDPWYVRYWNWLFGVSKCFALQCDFGTTRNGVSVNSLLPQAAASTMRLVVLATLIAIVVGVAIGILTAIRQYSGFDYVTTFLAFLFFSLPVFWAAVLLKEYGAIRFNDWIADPLLSPGAMILWGLGLGLILQAIVGGGRKRRLYTLGITWVFVTGALFYFEAVDWFRQPALGVGVVVIAAAGAAVLVTALVTGLDNRRVLYAALTTVVVGGVSYLALMPVLDEPNWWILFGLLVLAMALSNLVGWLWGGYDKRRAMFVSSITGFIMSLLVAGDQMLSHWASFLDLKPRPISTIGSETPNFPGGFWEDVLDKGTQLILPTILLALVSIAGHSRYTRSSMLEVMGQDYVRTARAKGLSERAVITKHAFRNALIPITTIVAFDFAALIGGAVITEQVFGWKGMGAMFKQGLQQVDPPPVMAFFLVTGVAAILMNLVADIAYAYLDPRIRR
ncbi:ABC transporter permease [Sediminihabitans luteus]|uniref:ABC transporter permease n=1 Tax=Sediminihabitans luteus TaxID=1138585 RepID=UPI000C24D69C|nr:ABC transporter permease [Sediminihabitans luteus]